MTLLHKSLLIAGSIAVLALLLRFIGLGTFMTVDEENWMLRSAGFYHNLFRTGDAGGTFMTTHPGATAMWLIGGGIARQEQRLGFDIDTSTVRPFRYVATLPIAIVTALLVGLITYLTARLWSVSAALWGGLLLAVEPYLVGMSQIAHLDALLSLLMLGSVLAFLLYAQNRRATHSWLLLSGILAGLAMGTKLLPALWLFVFFALVVFFHHPRSGFLQQLRRVVADIGFVFGVAAVTFWALWPALWFTDDVMRSFNRDVPSVITQEHVALELSEEPIVPATFYARTILGRTTPFVFLLVVVGLLMNAVAVIKYRRFSPTAWLCVYALGFLVLISFAAKKADRYALPALVTLPLLAGLIWSLAFTLLKYSGILFRWKYGSTTAGVVVGLSVIGLTLLGAPYGIAYNNPLFDVRPLPQQGWGEGLEAAAQWLNKHPLIDQLIVASWYPGVFRTYFDGTTMSLSSRDDDRVGFVVTYRNMEGRPEEDTASNTLDEFKGRKPDHVVYIQGVPYAWIYSTLGPRYFHRHVGELIGDMEVGQLVPVTGDDWRHIAILFATFSGRQNTEDVQLHIREDVNATSDLRTVVVNARELGDNAWHLFEFEPIADSAGKIYYVALTSPESHLGNAVTVRFTDKDVLPGHLVIRPRVLSSQERNVDFAREGDLAYRWE